MCINNNTITRDWKLKLLKQSQGRLQWWGTEKKTPHLAQPHHNAASQRSAPPSFKSNQSSKLSLLFEHKNKKLASQLNLWRGLAPHLFANLGCITSHFPYKVYRLYSRVHLFFIIIYKRNIQRKDTQIKQKKGRKKQRKKKQYLCLKRFSQKWCSLFRPNGKLTKVKLPNCTLFKCFSDNVQFISIS